MSMKALKDLKKKFAFTKRTSQVEATVLKDLEKEKQYGVVGRAKEKTNMAEIGPTIRYM